MSTKRTKVDWLDQLAAQCCDSMLSVEEANRQGYATVAQVAARRPDLNPTTVKYKLTDQYRTGVLERVRVAIRGNGYAYRLKRG